jgi:hypothetical protein
VNNAIDEFNVGAGDKIEVAIIPEGQVTVRDCGRGNRPSKSATIHFADSHRGWRNDKNDSFTEQWTTNYLKACRPNQVRIQNW